MLFPLIVGGCKLGRWDRVGGPSSHPSRKRILHVIIRSPMDFIIQSPSCSSSFQFLSFFLLATLTSRIICLRKPTDSQRTLYVLSDEPRKGYSWRINTYAKELKHRLQLVNWYKGSESVVLVHFFVLFYFQSNFEGGDF